MTAFISWTGNTYATRARVIEPQPSWTRAIANENDGATVVERQVEMLGEKL